MVDVERFVAGDREYVREVIREYEPMIGLICQSFARDEDHAEDLAQETWSLVCAKARSFDGTGTFRGWLYRVTMNVCLSDVRSRKARDEQLGRYAREMSSHRDRERLDPLAETERRELQHAIYRALPQLSENEREALILRIFEGRAPSEIAETMGIATATVRSHVRHAINRLRRMMEDPNNDLSRYGRSP